MNILIYNDVYFHPRQTFIYNEIIGVSNSHDVKLICLNQINKENLSFSNIDVLPPLQNNIVDRIKWLGIKFGLPYETYNKSMATNLSLISKTFKPDIIHLHFGPNAIFFLDNYKVKKSDRIFISYHGYDASRMLIQNHNYVRKLQKLHSIENIFPIVVSRDMYERMKSYNIPVDENYILYYGVQLGRFFRSDYKNNTNKVFIQVAGFTEKKGHIYTVKAFKTFLDKVENKNAPKLVLVGEGPLLNSIKELVVDLGIENNVEFPGLLKIDDVIRLLDSADYFIHHSVTAANGDKEGIPNAIIEAMAMEMPIISTYHSGIPELVEHNENGYLTKEKDIVDLASKMEEISTWSYLKKNRIKVQGKFSSTNHNKDLLRFYQSVK